MTKQRAVFCDSSASNSARVQFYRRERTISPPSRRPTDLGRTFSFHTKRMSFPRGVVHVLLHRDSKAGPMVPANTTFTKQKLYRGPSRGRLRGVSSRPETVKPRMCRGTARRTGRTRQSVQSFHRSRIGLFKETIFLRITPRMLTTLEKAERIPTTSVAVGKRGKWAERALLSREDIRTLRTTREGGGTLP